jgi:hypothetical protein
VVDLPLLICRKFNPNIPRLTKGGVIMKIFIAGIMQGSIPGKGIQSQNYRELIGSVIQEQHSDLELIDPYLLFPDSVEYGDDKAKEVLFSMADKAGSADLLIAYLPEASLGTALEMIRAYDNGVPILCISPLKRNWFILATATEVFSDMDVFFDWVRAGNLADYLPK